MEDTYSAYIGVKSCGCVRAILVDDDKTTAKEVGEFARRMDETNRNLRHVTYKIGENPFLKCAEHRTA